MDTKNIKNFKVFVEAYRNEIVNKWIAYFVYNKPIQTEIITKNITMVIEIIKADYIKDYQINFEFSDGSNKLVNFEPFLNSAKNPTSKKYLDKSEFQNFTLEFGDIVWNDYELCFPIWDLHQGKI
ncbi:uncharacterized protein YjbK [Pedobacter sp. UYP30]